MEKILVAIDGSKPSIRALAFAAARAARAKKAEVHIVYAQRGVRPTSLITKSMIDQWHTVEQRRVLSGARLKQLINACKGQIHIVTEEPAIAILDFARENGVTEIVMGTRGMGRLKGLVMGSVATKVAHLATVPVTLVK